LQEVPGGCLPPNRPKAGLPGKPRRSDVATTLGVDMLTAARQTCPSPALCR